ncbi:hypothetical protein SPRG_03814 [Saprolegnia parasitica CBS 223.65]|uniref:tRNA (guanine(9)-N(1))-methyltransferase n=1 Tax=Saprolegnia parasitica (strain CBS 223.65) TaxID=695850 RepID=A0A067CXH5_SAPPC|nr:hypothetical protein SPRG_03814 [Saprolegnia parasitica CBS 223.65]KDO31196.1 hypothetical protein SPRG_03814 [Saprolegnia parasitica CBS 223.65]|eukprot:XP_012197801.1 hypothetical protein SPRG_03814 [Saprolegnia parasitica CBS 223.65]
MMDETYEAKLERKTAELRQRKKDRRRELLCSMTADERRAFLDAEAIESVKWKDRLVAAQDHGQRLVIDCGYDEIMSDKEINSLSKQIKFSYGTTKRMRAPFALTIANYHGRIEVALQRFSISNWAVRASPARVDELFLPEELVFLTPDASTVLYTLDPTKGASSTVPGSRAAPGPRPIPLASLPHVFPSKNAYPTVSTTISSTSTPLSTFSPPCTVAPPGPTPSAPASPR